MRKVKIQQPAVSPQLLPLDDMTPVQRAFFIVWALSPEENQESLKAFIPPKWLTCFEPMLAESLGLEILKAYLKKMLDFETQFYFLGIHESWIQAQLGELKPAPLLLEVLKQKFVRLPYYEDLLETGRQGLAGHLIALGKRKAVDWIALQSSEIQEAVIKAMAEVTEGKVGPEGLDKLLQFNHLSSSELFKNIGLYLKNQEAVLQIAERMPFEEGQKLLSLFKSS